MKRLSLWIVVMLICSRSEASDTHQALPQLNHKIRTICTGSWEDGCISCRHSLHCLGRVSVQSACSDLEHLMSTGVYRDQDVNATHGRGRQNVPACGNSEAT